MHVRLASLAFAALALGSTAFAQETYDLRQLVDREPGVGERLRVEKEETRTQTMGPRAMTMKPASTFVEEVLALGEDGEPTRLVRAYELFRDEQGADVPVAGVVVELTRDEATGRHAFAAAEGSAPIPPALQKDLTGHVNERNKRAERGVTDREMNEVMFPAEPQPVGGTWTCDVARAVRMMNFEEGDVDVAQSSATGKVEGVEQVDGEDRLKFTVTLTLMMVKMGGRPLPAPAPLETVMTFRLPLAADGPTGDTHMTQRAEFQVPGPQGKVTVKIDGERKERRTRVE